MYSMVLKFRKRLIIKSSIQTRSFLLFNVLNSIENTHEIPLICKSILKYIEKGF